MANAMGKLAQTTYTFVLLNWAAVAGLIQFVRGHEGFWNVTSTGSAHRLRRV
ncbi:MAG: hypothetical protein M3N93_13055 [Acidobacteriota bacterium]|nr:hypothetical protein [Acidobacteriota bacterium]